MADAPPGLDIVLEHVKWRRAKLPSGASLPDIALDRKSAKLRVDRRALIDCAALLMNADDQWLAQSFMPRLDEIWRVAMGPKNEQEKLRYLSARLAADVMRAAGASL